jgi:catechol 2,3-dioxygenase-like lactoylglutathione lyase family enzyme
VTDLERSKRFYTQALGFALVTEGPGYVIVSANTAVIGLLGGAPQTPAADRFDPHRVGLDHAALGVSGEALEALKGQLDAAGVPNNGIEVDRVLGRSYVSFYDPDGIAWELYAVS